VKDTLIKDKVKTFSISKEERKLMKVDKQYSAGENYETTFKTIGKDTKSVNLYISFNSLIV